MARIVDDTIRLCSCCGLKLANDDTSGCMGVTCEHPHGVMGACIDRDIVLSDGEDDFSTARCDGCGSTLAGSRFYAVEFGN